MNEPCAICKKECAGWVNPKNGIRIAVHPECIAQAERDAMLKAGTICPNCQTTRKSKASEMCSGCRRAFQRRNSRR
jgi:hypothetical protein